MSDFDDDPWQAKPSPVPWILLAVVTVIGAWMALTFHAQRDQARAESVAAKTQAVAAEKKLEALTSAQAALQTQLEQVQAQKVELQHDNAALSARNEDLARQASAKVSSAKSAKPTKRVKHSRSHHRRR